MTHFISRVLTIVWLIITIIINIVIIHKLQCLHNNHHLIRTTIVMMVRLWRLCWRWLMTMMMGVDSVHVC